MNNIIGALIVSMAIGGVAPVNTDIDPNNFMPSIEADGTLVFGPTEAEKQEEAERLRRAEEARKAAEEAKDYQRKYSQSYKGEGMQIMKEAGVVFTDVDKEVWKEAASVVYDQAESLGLDQELVDKLTKK